MGHYKVFVMDEEVSSLLTAMINVGLQCGVSLKLWQNIINIMTEKRKVIPSFIGLGSFNSLRQISTSTF